ASALLDNMEQVNAIAGLGSIVSADRIFGWLEQDFRIKSIEQAVAQALQPVEDADLSAHQILLQLATSPEGKTRLVTTNFDLLFEKCNGSLPIAVPPRLPDPLRDSEFEGIIHLHGRVNDDYSGAYGDGFILSSSEFG